MDKNNYDYFVEWSNEDGEFVGRCAEFPSLSWLDSEKSKALEGIINLVNEVKFDMNINN